MTSTSIQQTGPLRWLRAVAFLEGCSLALLIGVAVPLKHGFGIVQAVQVMGPVHGVLFCAYVWLLARAGGAGAIDWGEAGRLLPSALVPFAAFLRLRRSP